MPHENLIGQRFGRLLVEQQAPSKNGARRWFCKCDCGGLKTVITKSLKNGNTTSCGCYQREQQIKANTVHGMAVRGATAVEHPIWLAWQNMKRRCDDPKNNRYHAYGGRGITYDPRWREFLNFKADMEPIWRRGLTLERKDVNGNYCKENCTWATRKTQMRNMRTNRLLTLNGVTRTMAEWAELHNVTHGAIWFRIKQGWSVEDALTKPFRAYKIKRGDP